MLEPNSNWVLAERRSMRQAAFVLDPADRALVLSALQKHCAIREWALLAAHVRSNHVHVIVEADAQPERILNEFKSYASRELNAAGSGHSDRKRWARHGSTRWLWNDDAVKQALRYVVEEQGDPMALFVADDL